MTKFSRMTPNTTIKQAVNKLEKAEFTIKLYKTENSKLQKNKQHPNNNFTN